MLGTERAGRTTQSLLLEPMAICRNRKERCDVLVAWLTKERKKEREEGGTWQLKVPNPSRKYCYIDKSREAKLQKQA